MNLTVRQTVSADAETCGRIIYDAFKNIADRRGFPPHFPTLESAIQRANFSITHPSIFGVVAESDGQIIGSNFLDERDPIRGLGPVTVDPSVQVHGVGRRLMARTRTGSWSGRRPSGSGFLQHAFYISLRLPRI
jgi:predicted N-acetyltransferase YhbS